jgi:hypothetical protein
MTNAPPVLLRTIKELIAKGDRAKQRSEDLYIAAGQHLKNLKENYTHGWAEWEDALKARIGISTGRASELMAIADGRKSLQQLRAEKNETSKLAHARDRAAAASLNSEVATITRDAEEEQADKAECTRLWQRVQQAEGERDLPTASQKATKAAPAPPLAWAEEHDLIEVLARSTPAIRSAAVEALISGSHQTQFDAVSNALADLYQRLSGAGR